MTIPELLKVDNLRTYFRVEEGTIKAVDGISFSIRKGETFGLAGESGSGKTTVAFSILGLLPHLVRGGGTFGPSKGTMIDGHVFYKGIDLLQLQDYKMRQLRGKEISMIFQNPMSSLNPIEFIGSQVGEAVATHDEEVKKEKIEQMVFDYLGKVDLAEARRRYRHNPHRFSGGEAQRIMMAMALIGNPSLLIADEPTSSLDVSVQRQVLELLKRIKSEFGLSMLFISHNLSIIAEMSDRVGVMYAGKIVEQGDVRTLYHESRHPYTQGLLAATPRIDGPKRRLIGIPGEPPNPLEPILGCRFHPRCKYATDQCRREEPEMVEVQTDHLVACSQLQEISKD